MSKISFLPFHLSPTLKQHLPSGKHRGRANPSAGKRQTPAPPRAPPFPGRPSQAAGARPAPCCGGGGAEAGRGQGEGGVSPCGAGPATMARHVFLTGPPGNGAGSRSSAGRGQARGEPLGAGERLRGAAGAEAAAGGSASGRAVRAINGRICCSGCRACFNKAVGLVLLLVGLLILTLSVTNLKRDCWAQVAVRAPRFVLPLRPHK